jgi:hypothetical protein
MQSRFTMAFPQQADIYSRRGKRYEPVGVRPLNRYRRSVRSRCEWLAVGQRICPSTAGVGGLVSGCSLKYPNRRFRSLLVVVILRIWRSYRLGIRKSKGVDQSTVLRSCGAFLVGVAGAKWITNEVDKRLLKESVKVAASGKKLPPARSASIIEGSARQVLQDVSAACLDCP